MPSALKGTAIPFPYDDLNALEAKLIEHANDTAAIMMEPLRSDFPSDGYLQGVRDLADKYGVLLIFDEVSTGFRPTPAGIQPILRSRSRYCRFAKSISNGYPMGAVVGSREAMEPAAQMFISSTYWSDTLGIRAAITTLNELQSRKACDTIHQTGQYLKQEVSALIDAHSLPASCSGVDWHLYVFRRLLDTALLNTLFIQEMAKRFVHMGTSFYINAAHGDSEIERTMTAINDVFCIIRHALDAEVVSDLIETIPRTDAFRRLVR